MEPGSHSEPPRDRGLQAVAWEMRRKEPGASGAEDAVPSCCIHVRAMDEVLAVFGFPVPGQSGFPRATAHLWSLGLSLCLPAHSCTSALPREQRPGPHLFPQDSCLPSLRHSRQWVPKLPHTVCWWVLNIQGFL